MNQFPVLTEAVYRNRRTSIARCGAMLPMIAILLPAILALSAFAINIAYLESVTTEIQCTTDVAARAAGREYALTQDQTKALNAARQAAAANPIGSYVIPIASGDLAFGRSIRQTNGKYTFSPSSDVNSVKVATKSLSEGHGLALQPLLPVFGLTSDIRPLREAISTQNDIDIVLVVDRSGSMAFRSDESSSSPPPISAPAGWAYGDQVPPYARWLDLVASVQIFDQEMQRTPQHELVALTAYNQSATVRVGLTGDTAQIHDSLDAISANFVNGSTNIGGGILSGLSEVTNSSRSREHASKVIVLMTDGVHNVGTDPVAAASQVASAGVLLFAISFSQEADQAKMRQVAESCGGQHFHASTGAQLHDVFREIARRLPSLLTK